MRTIEEMIGDNKGAAICTRLKAFGLKPVWLECVGGRIGIGIEFISDVPNWVKAFHLPIEASNPDAFISEINKWKNEVRRGIVKGNASTVVKKAIEYHGMAAVLDAMEDTAREAVN